MNIHIMSIEEKICEVKENMFKAWAIGAGEHGKPAFCWCTIGSKRSSPKNSERMSIPSREKETLWSIAH